MQVYPAILTSSLEIAAGQLAQVAHNPAIETVQIDIIDGMYADEMTLQPLDLTELDFGDLTIDIHLLTEEPMDYVLELIGLAEQLPIRAIIAQIERMSYQADFIEEVKRVNWKAGFSLDLFTPVEAIEDEHWSNLDVIQVLGNEGGRQGLALHPHALEKIPEVARRLAHSSADDKPELIVDIGVKVDNIAELKKLGVTGVSVGSELWKSQNLAETIAILSQA